MNLTLITHAIAALLAAGAVWEFQDARWVADVAEIRFEYADARLRAVGDERAKQRSITNRYEGALNDARTREALLRTEVDHLRSVSDGLRDQSAEGARRLATAPPAAVLEYATALGVVFNDCRVAYEGMVEKADGHASDVRTFTDAWPR